IKSRTLENLELLLSIRRFDFNSSYYTEPLLLHPIYPQISLKIYKHHPHRDLLKTMDLFDMEKQNASNTLNDIYLLIKKYWRKIKEQLEYNYNIINDIIFDKFNIDAKLRKEIVDEISLRLGEDPRNEILIPDLPPLEILIKRLLLHLVLEIVFDDNDGIVLLSSESLQEEDDLFIQIKEIFNDIFGEYADDRLKEVDSILGNKSSEKDAYPNLKHWLQKDLFGFHVKEFENTPIIWQLTSENLLSDVRDIGFSCLVDYHRLGIDTFDHLKIKYLDPRKVALRERRRAANQRRNDPSLEATERQQALEEFERCENNLRQIDLFEQEIQKLTKENPRDWEKEGQKLSSTIAELAAEFKGKISRKLTILDQLKESTDNEWFIDKFSPKFYENVNSNRDEWLDALEDLRYAGIQYSKSQNTPVEAHLYDLFVYANKLLGSTHYSSNGALFVYYYYKRGEEYLDKDGNPKPGLIERNKLFALLAKEIDDEIALGTKLKKKCKEISKRISSEWEDRAYEEITVDGYRPNKKHGVRINIKPLANAGIVPKIVKEKVL
ncbi:MAG: SAM-dependent methyltransferase, partial [Halanaerobiales bacterium]